MLSTDTKRKIDNARNILVGKIPNPQAQIEQITTALIYKFMDDMDEKSKTLGGKARFFVGDFEKYSWRKLLDPRIGGQERMNLYSEAVQNLSQNSALPQIFRDVFKDVFVPYRDPETLSLFLKEINWFDYHHSEELGNAYEYLLSIMSSQGDAGQFRTPRHIIDFIVEAVDPQKDETVLDPACGTAGFLISAYKHIVGANDGLDDITGLPTNQEERLKPEERAKMLKNFHGYDIDPGMVRLSLVNMYLHGFVAPNIEEYDSLTYEDHWNDDFDVILANPPFMTPRGGVRPHKRFQIQANRTEILFIDYIAEHLKPKGRAGIVVPEGIIFQPGKTYKTLRKQLVESFGLWAVVSLPAGVFQPYSPVKTSILFLDKQRSKDTDKILFFDITTDGFHLGSRRRPIETNDIPEALSAINLWKDNNYAESNKSILIDKAIILSHEDFSLNPNIHRRLEANKTKSSKKYPLIPLGDIIKQDFGQRITKKDDEGTKYPVYGGGGVSFYTDSWNRENEVVISRFAMSEQCVRKVSGKFHLLDSGFTFHIRDEWKDKLNKEYIDSILFNIQPQIYSCSRGHAQKNIDNKQFLNLLVPVPDLSEQKLIIKEIARMNEEIEEHEQKAMKIRLDIKSKISEAWGE